MYKNSSSWRREYGQILFACNFITGKKVQTEDLKTKDLMTADDKTADLKTKDKEKPRQKEKAYSVDAVRENHKKAYSSWTYALDEELTALFYEGKKINFLTTHFGRTKGAIQARVKKLGL